MMHVTVVFSVFLSLGVYGFINVEKLVAMICFSKQHLLTPSQPISSFQHSSYMYIKPAVCSCLFFPVWSILDSFCYYVRFTYLFLS